MANADRSAAPGPVPKRAHPLWWAGIRLMSVVALAGGAAVLTTLAGAPVAANATAGLPVSGACTIDAGFDGRLLTADDDFAPFPSAGDAASSGEDSALVGEACWVSATPPVPAPALAVQSQSSPPVPAAAQLPPVADNSAVGVARPLAHLPTPQSRGVPSVLVAIAVALCLGLAGVSGLRLRRLIWR